MSIIKNSKIVSHEVQPGNLNIYISRETSLLHGLQAQSIPEANSPIGKIHPFSKIAVTLEPVI